MFWAKQFASAAASDARARHMCARGIQLCSPDTLCTMYSFYWCNLKSTELHYNYERDVRVETSREDYAFCTVYVVYSWFFPSSSVPSLSALTSP